MPFEGKLYLQVWLAIAHAIDKMNDDRSDLIEYHAEKFRANRIHWHNAGMSVKSIPLFDFPLTFIHRKLLNKVSEPKHDIVFHFD